MRTSNLSVSIPLLIAVLWSAACASSLRAETARGMVFVDANRSGKYELGEQLMRNVPVSNGTQIVKTNAQGRYELEVGDDTTVFVIKPTGYRTKAQRAQSAAVLLHSQSPTDRRSLAIRA